MRHASSYYRLLALLVLGVGVIFPGFAHAATLSLSPAAEEVSVGDILTVNVLVNSNGQSINNAEGTISFPSALLSVLSVSKSNSIFPLWIQDPSFSNTAGTISFNGGVPNPGYSGNGGSILTITFTVKSSGTATLALGDDAVRADDGLGTDVLTSDSGAIIVLNTNSVSVPSAPPVTSDVPMPVISSATNPSQNSWYSISQPQLAWTLPPGALEVETIVSSDPNASPVVTYTPAIENKTLDTLSDGVWYFGIRARTVNGWSSVARYVLRVDTTPPTLGNVGIVYNSELGSVSISPPATDGGSGISYYIVSIDGKSPVRLAGAGVSAGTATIPIALGGMHTAELQAYDAAGNESQITIPFTITRAPAPIIESHMHSLYEGSQFVLSGTASRGSTDIIVFEQETGGTITTYHVEPDLDGHFTFLSPIWSQGAYEVWVQSETADGTRSDDSPHLYVQVLAPAALRIGSFVLTLPQLLGLLALLLLATIAAEFIGWRRLYVFKKKVHTDTLKTGADLHRGVLLLKEDLEARIMELREANATRRLTNTEKQLLEGLENDSADLERYIRKDLGKLDKEK